MLRLNLCHSNRPQQFPEEYFWFRAGCRVLVEQNVVWSLSIRVFTLCSSIRMKTPSVNIQLKELFQLLLVWQSCFRNSKLRLFTFNYCVFLNQTLRSGSVYDRHLSAPGWVKQTHVELRGFILRGFSLTLFYSDKQCQTCFVVSAHVVQEEKKSTSSIPSGSWWSCWFSAFQSTSCWRWWWYISLYTVLSLSLYCDTYGISRLLLIHSANAAVLTDWGEDHVKRLFTNMSLQAPPSVSQ